MPKRNTIEILINATDNASSVLMGVANQSQEIGKAVTLAFAGAVTAIGAATTAMVTKGIAEFQRFETGMNEVFTLLPGISQDAMDEMSDQVQNFSARMGVLSEDVVPALYQSISASVPQDNVFQFLEVAQKAALGGVTELETAVDGISSVMNAYGADVLSATRASDLMFTAVRLGKTDFSQLSASLFNVVPVAASMGIGFENITAALARLTAQGVPTSVASTQLRAAFTELADSGSEVSKAFAEVSGQSFRDFIAQGGNLSDALNIVQQAAEATGKPIDELFGSVEAAQAVLGLTGANAEAFAAALDEMGASAGATDAAFEQMNQGIGRAFARLAATTQNFFVNLGGLVSPILAPIIKGFSDVIQVLANVLGGQFGIEALTDALGEVPAAFRPILRILFPIAAGFRQLATDLDPNNPNGFFGALNAGMPLFTAIVTEIRRVMRAMGFSSEVIDTVANSLITLRNVLNTVWDAITAITAPIVEWVRNNIELKDVLIALGIAVASFVIPALIGIVTAFAPVIATFAALVAGVALLRKAWETDFMGIKTFMEETIIPFFTGLWDAFSEGGVSGAGTFIQDNVIEPLKTSIQNANWREIGGNLLSALGSALRTAVSWATWVYDNILKPMFDFVASAISQVDWMAVGQNILDALGSALVTLGTWATWVYDNMLVPMVDNARQAIENIDWFSVGEGIVNAIGTALKTTFDFIAWIIDSIFNPVTDGSEEASGQIDWANVGNAILEGIGSFLTGVFNFVTWLYENILSPLVQGAASAIAQTDWSGVGSGILNAIKNALGNIGDWAWNNIVIPIRDSIANFDLGSAISGAGDFISGGIQDIGNFISGNRQFGGQVSAGVPVRVGEAGAETFVPNTSGTILDAQQTAVAGGGMQPITIQFVFQRGISDNEARESAMKLKRELIANGIPIQS